MPRAAALPLSEGSVPWILHHMYHSPNSLSVTLLIGLSFQKQELQSWETMNKSWQVPCRCTCMDFEINFPPENSPITYECFLFCVSHLSSQPHSFPVPSFLPLPPQLSSHFLCLQTALFLFLLFSLSISTNAFLNLLWRQIKQEYNPDPAWLWFLGLDWHTAQLIA